MYLVELPKCSVSYKSHLAETLAVLTGDCVSPSLTSIVWDSI